MVDRAHRELGQKAEIEGREYGDGRTSRACIVEALRRSQDSQGILGEVGHRLFLRACLDTATEPAGFCDGVPPKSEILKSVIWRRSACESAAGVANDQACGRLMQAVQDRCGKTH